MRTRALYADHHQSVILVLFCPRPNVRKLSPPVDAGIGTEVDQDDFRVQRCGSQWLRVEPRRCSNKSSQLTSLTSSRLSGSDHAKPNSSNRRGRGTQETAAARIDFFDHRCLSIKDLPQPARSNVK